MPESTCLKFYYLTQIDTLILSNQVWHHLNRAMTPRPIQKIRDVSDAAIVVKETKNNYRLYVVNDQDVSILSKSKSTEMTRWFVVGFLKSIADGSTIRESFEYAIKYEEDHMGKT